MLTQNFHQSVVGFGFSCFYNRSKAWLMVMLLFGLLGGCTVGPDYAKPDMEAPDQWHQELTQGLVEGEADIQTWWTTLNDPVLDDLIRRAAANNRDLKVALMRIEEARAALGIARGAYAPAVDAGADAAYQRTSTEVQNLPPGARRDEGFYSTGLGASWEIDVFGRIKRSVEAADADLQGTVENYRDVLVLMYSDVAGNYVLARTFQQRIKYAQDNVILQRKTLKLTKDRFDAQLVPELDVRQAELNLARTESVIPTYKLQLARAVNRVAVLLGEYPSQLRSELAENKPIPKTPEAINVGLPTNLLRQRPDIRRAERQLASQTALIGVATAELYPQFSLLGSFSLDATEFTNMTNSGAYSFSFGPSVRWRIFDGGRIRSNIQVQESRTEQLLQIYEQTVLVAVEDVENSMVAFAQEQDRFDLLEASVKAASRSVELVQILYQNGLTDFQNVLDMERSLAEQQDELAQSEGEVVLDLISIYRALGGGWSPDLDIKKQEQTDDDIVEMSVDEPVQAQK